MIDASPVVRSSGLSFTPGPHGRPPCSAASWARSWTYLTKVDGGAVKSTSGSRLDLSRAKIEKMLGWVPEVDLEQGLRRLIDWRKSAGQG